MNDKEQAGRVEELERQVKGAIIMYETRLAKSDKFQQQSRRYREAIDEIREYITDCEKVDTEVVSYVIGDIIDEALEVDET